MEVISKNALAQVKMSNVEVVKLYWNEIVENYSCHVSVVVDGLYLLFGQIEDNVAQSLFNTRCKHIQNAGNVFVLAPSVGIIFYAINAEENIEVLKIGKETNFCQVLE